MDQASQAPQNLTYTLGETIFFLSASILSDEEVACKWANKVVQQPNIEFLIIRNLAINLEFIVTCAVEVAFTFF